MSKITLVMIAKNAEEVIGDALKSVKNLTKQMIVIDNNSEDNTIEIAERIGARVYQNNSTSEFKLRKYALEKANSDWIIVLDTDERLSKELIKEIKDILNLNSDIDAYLIPYQNFLYKIPLNFGGESYSMFRLFRKEKIEIIPKDVHSGYRINGKTGTLKNKILHYSYRSLGQMFTKFTDYSFREAQQKFEKGEKSSLKKIFMYGPHMFWARFIKDKGYKDGMFRIPLDLGFAYMEFLTYFLLAIKWLRMPRINH